MYLVLHQDDCQMVVGNVLKVRAWGNPESGAIVSLDGTEEDRQLPRQCTCEPKLVKWLQSSGNSNWSLPA